MRSIVIFLCILITCSIVTANVTVEDNGNQIYLTTSQLQATIVKNPWKLTITDKDGYIVLEDGDPREGGNPPEPPATPLAYYMDSHTFAPLTYRVDRKKRIKVLGQDIPKREAFRVQKVISWEKTANGAILSCTTDEVSNPKVLTLKVQFAFKEDNLLQIKANLSESRGVWNFSQTFRSFPDEHYFGLGEHFDTADSRGFVRGMQPEYSPQSKSTHNKTHLLVPFYISTRRHGIFAPIRRRGYFDMAASFDDLKRFAFDSDHLEFFVIVNKDPKNTFQTYMKMTGMPPLYPRWVFAPHQWRNVHKNDKEVYEDMEAMRKFDIPGSVIWIDNPWQTDYNDFIFNTKQFPKIKKLFQDMTARGYKIALWSSEFVNYDSKDFAEASKNNYLLSLDKEQTPFVMPWANGMGAPVNFYNKEARKWWQNKIRSCTDIGVSGWKLDYGEIEDGIIAFRLPYLGDPGIRFYNGKKEIRDVGSFRFNYHKTFNDVLIEDKNGDGFLICRTGTFGDQVNAPCIWPGDLDNDFSFHKNGIVGGLPAGIAGGISTSMSGFPYYGSDIGGFRKGTPSKEVIIRWAQFATFSPVMQLGGGGNHNVWDETVYDRETREIYQKYARLHTDLFPYLYTYADISHRKGLPIMRAMFLEYPEDTQAAKSRFQYMFGEAFLVAPIYQAGETRNVYLPRGQWIDYWTGKVYNGPREITVTAPLDTLPLFVKNGSIIPMIDPEIDTLAPATDPDVVTWEQKRDHLIVNVYPKDNSQFTLYDGTVLTSDMAGSDITLQVNQSPERRRYTWRVQLLHKTPVVQVLQNKAIVKQCTSKEDFTKAKQGWYQESAGQILHVKVSHHQANLTVKVSF